MAGKIALMERRNAVKDRLTTATNRLIADLGIDLPSVPTTGKDADLLAVVQLETMADVVEAVAERIAHGAAPAETADAEAHAETDADPAGTPEPDSTTSTAADAPGSPTRRRSARKAR